MRVTRAKEMRTVRSAICVFEPDVGVGVTLVAPDEVEGFTEAVNEGVVGGIGTPV